GTISHPTPEPCGRDAFQHIRLHRRQVLSLGGLTGTGLLLADLFRARAAAAEPRATFGRTRSVIMLYLHGGHAQQETFDPKPDGPSPERGEFGAIATTVPGVRVSELLPRCAQVMHRLAVIRSLSHGTANHVQASLWAMPGHAHPPEAESRGDFPPAPSDFPPIGAVQSAMRQPGPLPTWTQVGPLMRRANGPRPPRPPPPVPGGRPRPPGVGPELHGGPGRAAGGARAARPAPPPPRRRPTPT